MVTTPDRSIEIYLVDDPDFVKTSVEYTLNSALEEEMTELLNAAKGERTHERSGFRSRLYNHLFLM